jgi:hypothetical protein
VLQEAVQQTIERRRSHLKHQPVVFEQSFVNEQKIAQWRAFLKRTGLDEIDFELVMQRIIVFLQPIFRSIINDKEFFKNWDCKIADWK